jgi:Contractile injection system tape measure protein
VIPFPHTVRKQILELAVGSETLAFSLQPRLADWNRRRLLPAIEQVLDELAVPGRQIRIDRLEIDLGAVLLADLEEEGERRLRRELRRALEKALRGLAAGSSADGRWRPEEVARRELLEHLLLHGTLPFWVPRRPEVSLESLVLAMAQDEPESLVAAVRALGHRGRVLERLVVQLRETTLARLVGLLEPLHAALILDYLGHLRAVHREEPLLPLSDRDLGESLWFLVQAYLVRDPGSQFNRKSFVRSLLQGLADARGLAYAAILATLRLGLERMARHRPLRSSLPAVVAELIRERGLGRRFESRAVDASPPSPAARLAKDAFGAGRAAGARQLLRVIRDAPELRQDVMRDCPAPLFERMLGQLLPAEGGVLRALLQALAAIPSPYRPRPDSLIREVVFDQALLLGRGEPLGEGFFTRVLRDLFTWPLAEPVRRTLLEQVAAWSGDGRLPAPRVAAFRAAVEVAAGSVPPVQEHLADHELREALSALLGDPAEEAGDALRRQVADRRTRHRWVRVLSETTLVRLAGLLEPRRHRALLAAAEVLAAAWRETAPPGHPALTGRRAFWGFLLDLLSRPAAERSVERLVTAFFAHSAARTLAVAPDEPDSAAEEGARLLAAADRLAREGGHTGLFAALQRDRRTLLAPWQPAAYKPAARRPRRLTPRRPAQGRPAEDGEAAADAIYIDNAGLVLAAPFLPPLFQTLDMLRQGDDGRIRLRDAEAASRAVHLLQFLVDGRTDAPEPLLVLNKILCGVPLGAPVLRAIEITESEREVCDKLLRSLLAGWTAIANTSVAGLRETFLQREGKLRRGDEGWTLRVQRKTVDVLVDDVPWSLSVVLHRWMAQPVHVRW